METDAATAPGREALGKSRNDRSVHEPITPSASRGNEKATAPIGQSNSDGIARRRRWEALRREQAKLLEVVASGRPLEECLLALTRAVEKLVPNSRAAVLTADETRGKLDRTFSAEIPPSFGQAIQGIPIDDLTIATCGIPMFSDETVTCADVRTDDRWADAWRDLCVEHGILAGHSTPIIGPDGKTFASFFLGFAEAHAPDEYERKIGEFGARIAGIALGHDYASRALRASEARLSAELEDARLLQGVSSEMIRGGRIEKLYEKIMDAAVGIMESDFASMQMLVPERGEGGDLRLLAFRGFDPEAARFWKWVGLGSESCCGEALRTGQRIVVPDVEICEFMADSEDLAIYRRIGMRAMQTTPLISRTGKLLGMISTHWKRAQLPSERGLRALDVLARQAADLIERRQAEEAVTQQAQLLELSNDAIFTRDLEGRVLYWNRGAEAMYGWPREEALGQPVNTLLQTEFPRLFEQIVADLYREGQWSGEFMQKSRDGKRIVVLVRKVLRRDEAGNPVNILESATDITDRKAAEDALREQEEEARILEQVGSTLAAELDSGKLVQAVTDAGKKLCGAEHGAFFYNVADSSGEKYMLYTLSGARKDEYEKIGMPRNTEIFQPTFAGECTVRLDDVTKDPRFGKNEPHFGLPEGHPPVCSYLAVPVVSRFGEVLGGLFYAHFKAGVFTERGQRWVEGIARQAAIAMDNARLYEVAHQSAERFRFLAETMPQKIFTARPNGDVDYFNPQWMEYTGTTFEQIGEWGWMQIIHPDDLGENVRRWKHSIDTGEPFQFEHRLRRADGEYRWHYSRALPFRDADGRVKLWIGTNTDVEDRRRSEEVLLRTEKLAAAGRLAATVAHEINNPLESITNLLYLARQDETMSAQAREYLQMAGSELDRAAQVARQTLGFYRDTVAPGWLDPTTHIHELLEMYKYKLRGRDVKLEGDGEVEIFAPAGEFRQIFSNLLVNAADATEPGSGRIRVRVRAVEERSGPARRGVRITVADNGCGIPSAGKSRIFEPFYTTKRDVGTGLGLWLSRKLAQKHGASLRVRSRVRLGDSGTVFSVFWPVVALPESNEPEPALQA